MKQFLVAFLVVVLAVLVAVPTFAAAASSAPLTGRLSLGYNSTSGNTDEQKTNFNFDLAQQRSDKLKFGYTGQAIHGRANGETNADRRNVQFTSEFIRNTYDSFYLNTGYLRDTFAGFDRRLNAGAGLYRYFRKSDAMNLRGSLGLDFTKEDYTDGTNNTLKWLKAGLSGNKSISQNIQLSSFIDLSGPSDGLRDGYRVDYMVGGTYVVNQQIDVEVKYLVNYRKNPMVDGKVSEDTNFLSGIVYKM